MSGLLPPGSGEQVRNLGQARTTQEQVPGVQGQIDLASCAPKSVLHERIGLVTRVVDQLGVDHPSTHREPKVGVRAILMGADHMRPCPVDHVSDGGMGSGDRSADLSVPCVKAGRDGVTDGSRCRSTGL